MIKISAPNKDISGKINLTASKSESNRALVIQALCETDFEIDNLAEAKDTETLVELLSIVKSNNNDSILTLDVGPAGTTFRFLTAFLSVRNGNYILTGSERMLERPCGILVGALQSLGADIKYLGKEGYPPLQITGRSLDNNKVNIKGNVSSQFISALMLIAPSLKNGLTINFTTELVSKPYITMTSSIMSHFGAEVKWNENGISISNKKYEAKNFTVEADWSAASYWYEIACLAKSAEIELTGLKKESLQADANCVNIFAELGVKTSFNSNGVTLIKKENKTSFFKYDFEECPDIAQTLAVTLGAKNIESKLYGLQTLKIKETDRIIALKTELKKFDCSTNSSNDSLYIDTDFKKEMIAEVATYHDHRMAMAFAPLALVCSHIFIEDENVVEKSYPKFWEDLKQIGFSIE